MPSQFFGLNIAYKGLLAANAATNTAANNISNVQTPGYSRQQVVQQASDALRVFQTYGCAGAGVETLAIERMRDEFYDTKYWNNNAKVGEYGIKEYYMTQIENYFADDATTTGFKTIFDQMMVTGLQEVLKNAGSTASKKQFIGFAESLTEYFNNLAGNMEVLQKDVNQEIKIKVDEINSLAGEIAALNKQINVIELSGSKANELRDRRALLIDQLSEIVDVEVVETPVFDTNNPDRQTGANRFLVKIAGGQTLVDTNEFNGLECVARTNYEKINQTDIDGLYEVYWEDGQKFNLYNASMGGTLQGLIQMRDGNNGENFQGTIESLGTTVDRDGRTQDTVTIRVDHDYLKDLNKCNLSDQGGEINLGNQMFYYKEWECSISYDDAGNAVYSYTFTLDKDLNDRNITNDRVGKHASIGSDINYQGIPYYMNQMNEWVRTFSQKVNAILNSGYDKYNSPGNNLFTGNMPTTDDQFDFESLLYFEYDYEAYQAQIAAGGTGGMTVTVNDESYYKLTAKNFAILDALIADADLLATRKDSADGIEKCDLLEELKEMVNDKEAMSFRGSKVGEFLQCILSDIALNTSSANTFYTNYKNVAASIDIQRTSVSGVDEDEEAISLVKFQNAYNLSSKMIQVLTEMYDKLILDTGV